MNFARAGRGGSFSLLVPVVLWGCAARPAENGWSSPSPAEKYEMYVANESSDLISRVVFRPDGGVKVVGEIPVGILPADIDAPHGITVSPDGQFWYVSLAHGTPNGTVWKFDRETDQPVGAVTLGMFPATLGITPDGQFLFVVNFNLHGDHVPSSVSVVYTPTMTEIARPTTCVMPHGSRINASGMKHYSACMHSHQLVEIDTRTFRVTGRMLLAPGHERRVAADFTDPHGEHPPDGAAVCSPTWAQPGKGAWADFVYVPCSQNAEVLEIDVESWLVTRRFPTGRGPYNLDVTPDGRWLLATLKGAQGVAIFDLLEGRERARIATTQPITHGVVVSPDGRYAFVTNEAIGSTPGTVDVIDMEVLERIASTELRHQPGGIDLLPLSPNCTRPRTNVEGGRSNRLLAWGRTSISARPSKQSRSCTSHSSNGPGTTNAHDVGSTVLSFRPDENEQSSGAAVHFFWSRTGH